jgi:predicted nucleotidyltransferase
VIKELTDRTEEVAQLCRQFRVQRLDVFGSASTGHFDPLTSDLDFVVVFESLHPKEHADAYFGLLSKLQELFSRNIDLIELEAINNPYFLETVEESRSVLYAA